MATIPVLCEIASVKELSEFENAVARVSFLMRLRGG